MLPLLAKVDPGQIPLSPHPIMTEGQALEAPLHQNKIPLLKDIPLASGQIPPDQDLIPGPQGVDHPLNPEAINTRISPRKVIERTGGENFINCNSHQTLQKKMRLATGNSC